MEPTQANPTQVPQPQPGEIVLPTSEAEVNASAELPEATVVDEPTGAEEETLDSEDLEGQSEEPAFQWQASEYVQHHKGMGWYSGLAGVLLILLGIAIFTQQWLSIAVFIVMAAAVVVYAHKPPRMLLYQLDSNGIIIEGKPYAYPQFRSFSVLQDIEWHAIDLEPTQRFMPRLTIIFDETNFDSIVDHLSLHLPRTDRQPDIIERLSRFVRF